MEEYSNSSIYKACEIGDLDYIKSFFEQNENSTNYMKIRKDLMLLHAMKKEKVNIVNYVLNISKNICNDEKAVMLASRFAASNNKLNVLKSIFSSFSDDKHLNENFKDGSILEVAAMIGYMDIVQYLCELSNLKSKIDIHARNDAVFVSTYQNKNFDVLKYFVFDLNIDITSNIQEIIKANKNVAHMFELREINKSLKKELEENKNNSKQIKI